jgi:hypothetical protein
MLLGPLLDSLEICEQTELLADALKAALEADEAITKGLQL